MRSEKKENLSGMNVNLWVFYPDTFQESIHCNQYTILIRIFNFINNAKFKNEIKKVTNRLDFNDFIIFTTAICLGVFN
jgi:hypothetical protein